MTEITFVEPDGTKHRVRAENGTSVMRAAVENDVPGVVGECGGSMTCGTCHVYVDDAWQGRTGIRSEEEEFMLEYASEVRPQSRLCCQILVDETLEGLVVHVPASDE
ncbi:ferredoxin [Rhizobium sp. CF080]|uniref:2Fe-2S iron-sulfur cluster-binding protein n=1 Tax=Rhizobium sp. (strain CF080) TaxID=1144310 RepID=UPI000271D5A9|nr:2Fe-2S iron-sulfur cluster-binding protein [Rhizobium sp. CF080]EUB98926.1 ferredoxin [Rhizobium sp. CF080]